MLEVCFSWPLSLLSSVSAVSVGKEGKAEALKVKYVGPSQRLRASIVDCTEWTSIIYPHVEISPSL